jgi:hypothetical protein
MTGGDRKKPSDAGGASETLKMLRTSKKRAFATIENANGKLVHCDGRREALDVLSIVARAIKHPASIPCS